MLLAKTEAGARIEPRPRGRARCPQCDAAVVAKCGKLVSWHWSHRAAECDSWSEGETEWHLSWKRRVEPAACEVVLGNHRADIRTAEGRVIELQHSPIDSATLAEREAFYSDLVWLFDAESFKLELHPSAARVDFVWKHVRKSLLGVSRPMYWDLGSGFAMQVLGLLPDAALGGVRGRGVLLDTECLASSLFGRSARADVHALARQRSQRVSRCLARAHAELRLRPSQGIDAALRSAMLSLR